MYKCVVLLLTHIHIDRFVESVNVRLFTLHYIEMSKCRSTQDIPIYLTENRRKC